MVKVTESGMKRWSSMCSTFSKSLIVFYIYCVWKNCGSVFLTCPHTQPVDWPNFDHHMDSHIFKCKTTTHHWVCPSVVLSVCLIVSAQHLLNRSTIFFTKFGMVVYYHEAMCHAEKLVHYFQCQGHNEGLYYQNWTTFTISSKLLACLQPNLVW